ncbi:histidine phosphatase family protein [Candidatus Woesearchaeota archaeon]|nr:MAG: histidine phosphatase family protein [Candidatus Woesearchaeota archaeon]
MRLTIVRHGETEENLKGIIQGHTHGTLSKRGREQVRRLAARLKNEQFCAIYSSDLGRAKHTAFTIAVHHDAPLTLTPLLRERDWGEYNGRLRAPSGEPRFGETKEDVQRRAHEFLKKLHKYERDHVLVVSHNGFCKALIRAMTGHQKLPNLKNASVTVIDIEGPRDTVRVFNCTKHL